MDLALKISNQLVPRPHTDVKMTRLSPFIDQRHLPKDLNRNLDVALGSKGHYTNHIADACCSDLRKGNTTILVVLDIHIRQGEPEAVVREGCLVQTYIPQDNPTGVPSLLAP